MSMSRKDYRIIADGFARALKDADEHGSVWSAIELAIVYVADELKIANLNFDRSTFCSYIAEKSGRG